MFFVQEFQLLSGRFSVLSWEYSNIEDAYEKYYDVLRHAVKSDTERHGAVIFDDYFDVITKEVYTHKGA